MSIISNLRKNYGGGKLVEEFGNSPIQKIRAYDLREFFSCASLNKIFSYEI